MSIVTEFFGAELASELDALHQQGLLGPYNIFIHCTALPDKGWEILREAGVRVNVCPRSDAHYGILPAADNGHASATRLRFRTFADNTSGSANLYSDFDYRSQAELYLLQAARTPDPGTERTG